MIGSPKSRRSLQHLFPREVIIMRVTVIILGMLVAFPVLALGQVSVPFLEMAGVGFPPLNPAAVAWDRAPRVSVGRSEGYFHNFNQAGAVVSRRNVDGRSFEGAFVSEFLSGEVRHLELEFSNNTHLTTAIDMTYLGAAVRIGDGLALGIGRQEETSASPGASDILLQGPMAGASLRVGEAFFAGVALGTQSRTESGVQDAERSMETYGVGLRFLGEANGFMIEYSVENKEAFTLETAPGVTATFDQYESDFAVIQVMLQSIVLGFSVWNQEIFNETVNQVLSEHREGWMIGWSPTEGFGLNAQFQERVREDSLNNLTRRRERTRVAAVYRF